MEACLNFPLNPALRKRNECKSQTWTKSGGQQCAQNNVGLLIISDI